MSPIDCKVLEDVSEVALLRLVQDPCLNVFNAISPHLQCRLQHQRRLLRHPLKGRFHQNLASSIPEQQVFVDLQCRLLSQSFQLFEMRLPLL